MSKGQFFIGAPVNFKPGVDIYPPKIKEVLSNKKYPAYIQVLTYSHEEIEDLYVEEKKDIKTSNEKICPRCGEKMVLRVAKKGNNAGNKFYGCSAFPKCRYIEELSE